MASQEWLLLVYKVPPEPARKRIAVWRKLKGLGAVYVQGGVCVLPRTDDHLRRLKMLENEIAETAGESLLLTTTGLDQKQEEKIVARFNAERDDEYKELLEKCAAFEAEVAEETRVRHFTYAELGENDEEVKKFRSWLAKIRKLDFYNAPRGQQAVDKIAACEAILDAYAQRVFDAHEENRGDRP